jgi:hypothetical protein
LGVLEFCEAIAIDMMTANKLSQVIITLRFSMDIPPDSTPKSAKIDESVGRPVSINDHPASTDHSSISGYFSKSSSYNFFISSNISSKRGSDRRKSKLPEVRER